MQAEADNRGEHSEGRKTRMFPRSLVQGTMGADRERHPAALCEEGEGEKGGGMGLKTSKHIKWSTCCETTHTFVLLHSRGLLADPES